MLFGGTALVGRVDAARTLFGNVEPWLPAVGKRNTYPAWAVLEISVPGLMLAGDIVRCGALYPLCVSYLSTGVIDHLSIVPGSPETVAGIAAYAAGLRDRGAITSKLRSVRPTTLPHRLLQPTARYWYGTPAGR